MDSVEATLNVPVDYYVRVNMDAFVEALMNLAVFIMTSLTT